ncbi:MAG: Stp1/IreP family PP2C-type Ser/Thr phosphatase [Lachnospiraceae bacterium]|nr:Stp1/IreP family PP2C-type Ser/Thr phosphatase [Lachnospiraceae bacterium]
MKAFSITDIGKKRQLNQDFVFTSELPLGSLPNLFVVADGMGGHKAGDFASKYTVKTMIEEVVRSKDDRPVEILRNAIKSANEFVRRKARDDANMVGMGTTVVAATYKEDVLYVANVGDSRLYVVNESISQITRDHSLVEEMVRIGSLDREAARNHPDKNIITRAVGATEYVNVDFFEVSLKPGDIVLMCTDGLTNMMEDSAIHEILLKKTSLEMKAKELVDGANDNGGSDNIAVVLIELLE